MNFKKFLTAIRGVQMSVVPSGVADTPFGAAHAEATNASAPSATATVAKFEISDALVQHTFRRRHIAPAIQR